MPRDFPEQQKQTAADEPVCRCAACRAPVTKPQWATAINGAHERALFNPAGRVFRVVCYRHAPGAGDWGALTNEFTWFTGYAWVIALCRHCGAHLGWRYEGDGQPPIFFGLIKPMLDIAPEQTSR